jgi:hypothetical protein
LWWVFVGLVGAGAWAGAGAVVGATVVGGVVAAATA